MISHFFLIVQMGGVGCGGALIAPDVALFAAHCGDWTGEQISIGAYRDSTLEGGAQERFCDEWVKDPKYNAQTTNYDFALCKLNKPITIDASVTLELNLDHSVPAAGEDLDVMGLGALSQGGSSPEYLHKVTVPAIDNDVCNQRAYYDGEITDIMLCAGFLEDGGKDSCQGDSGGPIVKKIQRNGKEVHLHVGVVSWGYGCAQATKPGVYARTSKRSWWIKNIACNQFNSIADFCDNEPPPAPTTCGNELKVEVTTDRWAYETEWTLTDSDDTEILTRKYLIKNYQNDHTLCLKPNECYTWEISDFDGIPQESYFLYVNGEEVASGNGNFAGTKKETFCTGADVTNPTAAPVPSPTEAPVPSPTEAPVPSPTEAPVPSPTEAPVPSPTEAPVPSPTPSPTEAPITPQTESPTSDGTIWNSQWGTWAPTWSPTDFPTFSPTEDFCTDSPDFFFKNKQWKTCTWVGKGGNNKVRKKCNKKWKKIRVYDWCPETCGLKVGLGQCAR